MNTTPVAGCYEISPRFRRMIEERIERLERDAVTDEINSMSIHHEDHMRRHLRLVAVQRAEALRMRLFLDKAGTRMPNPLIEK
jgi:ribosome-associated translation inhibitor RaiA